MIVKGQKINNRYQITRMIGEGGMANVYLAHDLILDREVAVKVLRGDLAEDEKFVRRFQREAVAASSLSHPNIVEMYDVGEDDGIYFIVMEYIDGKTLKSLIKKRGYLTLHEVVDIMLQLTSGLSCAHDSYIIHRDIKPQNIMILEDGTVKITDFGIAMALNSNELTQTNSVMGSVHYLPPEQANGNGATIKSDIYSLGILMYELLTGILPFKGENAVEIAIKQMKESIPSLVRMDLGIPQSIENIVLKACAKNPKNRYDNVLEMREDLKVALNVEHANDARIVYEYPEQELEETKTVPNLRSIKTEEREEDKKEKKVNKGLIITSIVTFVIILIACTFIFIVPAINNSKEIKIPNVEDMSLEQAESLLEEKGFTVSTKVKKEFSTDIKKDKVIGTEPAIGRTAKKKSEITLIVSKGSDLIELDDYIGQNAAALKTSLEKKGLVVAIETKKVEDMSKAKEGIVIEQTPKKGEKLKKNDILTLYIAEIYTVYPNFLEMTVADAREFCDQHGINLNITYEEVTEGEDGKILKQDRTAGVEVFSGANLTLTVSKKVKPVATPSPKPSATPSPTPSSSPKPSED